MPDHQPQSGAPAGYELAAAAADLAAAGLLIGAVTGQDGAWRKVPPAELRGGFVGACLDSRQVAAGMLFVGLVGPRRDGREFAAGALAAGAHALVGPGLDRSAALDLGLTAPAAGTVLVCTDPLAAATCLARHWRQRQQALVLGITGSNGKTTTKDLLAAILSGAGPVHATGGNLNSEEGVPVTLLGLQAHHRFAVIEMGASAVGHIAARAAIARPFIGIITNAAAAHLAEFGDLDGVIRGKGELAASLPPEGTAILGADSPGFDAWCARTVGRVISFGQAAGDHRWDWRPGTTPGTGLLLLDGRSWPVPLPGRHNGGNLCAAILAARAAGLDDAEILRGLATFRASPHRAALRRLGGRLVLDDCYNANPESMRHAGQMLCDLPGGETWAVLGGMAELGEQSDAMHLASGRALAELGIGHLVAVGSEARLLAEGFAAAGGTATTLPDHGSAAALLAASTRPGDRILVKGSRSMGMERVIEALGEQAGWTEDDR
jgi:UDP-N-acetylmuramoyl-tripeptide--D-alanyl-D-alanine ligase